MSTGFKPPDYSTVSPYLVVDGAEKTIQFLIEVFDAEELRRLPGEDGGLIHAEVRLDDTAIMLADANEAFPPVTSHVHAYVPEVDTVYQQALEAGGPAVQEPQQYEGEQE